MKNVTQIGDGKSLAFLASLDRTVTKQASFTDLTATAVNAEVVYYLNTSTGIGANLGVANTEEDLAVDSDETLFGFFVQKYFTRNFAAGIEYQLGEVEFGNASVDIDVLSISITGRFGG